MSPAVRSLSADGMTSSAHRPAATSAAEGQKASSTFSAVIARFVGSTDKREAVTSPMACAPSDATTPRTATAWS